MALRSRLPHAIRNYENDVRNGQEIGPSALHGLVGKAAVGDNDIWCHSKRMHTSPAIDAAPQFMAVVQDGQVPTDAALTGALGRRIAAYHVTADAEPSDGDLEAPPP